jgi:cell division septum initiation protein DivIVA
VQRALGLSTPSVSKSRLASAADSARDAFAHGVDSLRHTGEGFVDRTIHGFEETVEPIKDAFLNAKDKVVGAAGFSKSHPIDDALSQAKHEIEEFGSSVLKSAQGVMPDIKNIIDSASTYFTKGSDDLTSQVKSYADSISKKSGYKAEDLTGMTQKKREELAIKAKKNIDQQSIAAKRKVDDAAVAAKKRVDDLAYSAKKAADKVAGHSTWRLW